jgi:hypothetical protein
MSRLPMHAARARCAPACARARARMRIHAPATSPITRIWPIGRTARAVNIVLSVDTDPPLREAGRRHLRDTRRACAPRFLAEEP